jgi:hypothetical protein
MPKKTRKIDRVIALKVEVFDMIRKLELLQNAAGKIQEIKTKHLQELQSLEEKLVNRQARTRTLISGKK